MGKRKAVEDAEGSMPHSAPTGFSFGAPAASSSPPPTAATMPSAGGLKPLMNGSNGAGGGASGERKARYVQSLKALNEQFRLVVLCCLHDYGCPV